jgi:hypothetical protein
VPHVFSDDEQSMCKVYLSAAFSLPALVDSPCNPSTIMITVFKNILYILILILTADGT